MLLARCAKAGSCSSCFFLGAELNSGAAPARSGSGSFNDTGSLATAREYHSATLLPNGKALVAGGFSFGTGILGSAELYDPASGTWSGTGSLTAARAEQTATLLPNGKVLVAGGTTILPQRLSRQRGTVRSSERDLDSDRQHEQSAV